MRDFRRGLNAGRFAAASAPEGAPAESKRGLGFAPLWFLCAACALADVGPELPSRTVHGRL